MKSLIRIVFPVILQAITISCLGQYSRSNYLKPDSFLEIKTHYELRIIRNEVFARKGYVFNNKDLQEYFKKQPWYIPKPEIKITLTEEEENYVKIIKNLEQKKKKEITLNNHKEFKLFFSGLEKALSYNHTDSLDTYIKFPLLENQTLVSRNEFISIYKDILYTAITSMLVKTSQKKDKDNHYYNVTLFWSESELSDSPTYLTP